MISLNSDRNGSPSNEVREIDQPRQSSTGVLELEHDEVREDGWNKQVEYAIAKGVVQQAKSCHCGIYVSPCNENGSAGSCCIVQKV